MTALNASALAPGGSAVAKIQAAGSTNATSVKAAEGRVYGWSLTNTSAALKYVKLYNKAAAPTVGTDVPVLTIGLPATSTVTVALPFGIAFRTGIAYAITGVSTDADTTAVTANDVTGGLFYA